MRSGAKNAVIVIALAVVVGFIAAEVNAVREQHRQTRRAIAMTQGNPDRAVPLLARYGCAACHQIPGTSAPGGLAAPPLSDIGKRLYVGGATPNTPDNLIAWIVNPKKFSPHTAMPVTGISEAEARDVAAYLYQLR